MVGVRRREKRETKDKHNNGLVPAAEPPGPLPNELIAFGCPSQGDEQVLMSADWGIDIDCPTRTLCTDSLSLSHSVCLNTATQFSPLPHESPSYELSQTIHSDTTHDSTSFCVLKTVSISFVGTVFAVMAALSQDLVNKWRPLYK